MVPRERSISTASTLTNGNCNSPLGIAEAVDESLRGLRAPIRHECTGAPVAYHEAVAASRPRAFCMVPRLTGSRVTSSDSAGIRSPGLKSPRWIASVNASSTCLYFGPARARTARQRRTKFPSWK